MSCDAPLRETDLPRACKDGFEGSVADPTIIPSVLAERVANAAKSKGGSAAESRLGDGRERRTTDRLIGEASNVQWIMMNVM